MINTFEKKMTRIRPFNSDDIPRVAKMIGDTFTFAKQMDLETISWALDEVIFNNPWVREELPSLVYEHSDGSVKGFLGVSPRIMSFNGKKIKVAITHNYVVEPGIHAALSGTKLFKTLLDGSQDLVISGSAGDPSKFIMEKSGGAIGYLYSTGWRIPVKPMQCGLNYLTGKWNAPLISKVMSPFTKTGEFLMGRIMGEPFRYRPPEGTLRTLSPEAIVKYQNTFSRGYSLRPDYTPASLQWVLDIAARARHLGDLEILGIYDGKDHFLGWVIYYLKPGGRCEVLQMAAKEGKESQVLNHLIYHTWKKGAAELVGRVEPAFMRALSRSWALFVPGRMWMLLHGNPDIVSAISSGDAFLSRLEDDVWLL
jgi:hypothetical protein